MAKDERRTIFAILCERTATPAELSEELEEGLSHVNYHVRVLRACDMVEEDNRIRGGTLSG